MREVMVNRLSKGCRTDMDDMRRDSRHLKMDVTVHGLTHFGVYFVFMVVVMWELSGDSQSSDQHD